MTKSMTGYGKITEIFETAKITVEIKTLNSKNFNPYIKIPEAYNEKEAEIKNLLYNSLEGGKISFNLTVENENQNSTQLNKTVINKYYQELSDIAKSNNLNPEKENIFQAILSLPDVLKNTEQDIDKNIWNEIKETIKKTISDLDKFRKQEGKALEKDILEKVKNIEQLIPEVEKYEDERIETTSKRIKAKLNDFLNGDDQNKDRFEQEIIYYLDKFDLNEEKTRLKNHCKYFYETIKLNEPIGTKLGFITQEMGREINTIGSKANHSEIQKIVVNMKDNLGKMKEQLLNVL
ncbi:MAG: YicC family protein [Bacteroidales bacterium]|nr:YicC family protein [Bacteroidales bacterium]